MGCECSKDDVSPGSGKKNNRLRFPLSSQNNEPKFIMSKANMKDLKMIYDIDTNLLGSGSFGKVFKATNKKDASIAIAIKVIAKYNLDVDDLQSIKNEVQIMQKLDHPNIVKYFETYDDIKYIYLCMELC